MMFRPGSAQRGLSKRSGTPPAIPVPGAPGGSAGLPLRADPAQPLKRRPSIDPEGLAALFSNQPRVGDQRISRSVITKRDFQ
jgi:hypothetical protein